MTSRFNLISNWVATVYVTTENLKARTKVLKKFIEVADLLKTMGNSLHMCQNQRLFKTKY